MKGYNTSYGYMGLIRGEWILFATETDYVEACDMSEEYFNDSDNTSLKMATVMKLERHGKLCGARC